MSFLSYRLSSGKECKEQGVTNVPQRDDDELRVLGPISDVIGDDGYVRESSAASISSIT
jgi:hypothetical protein